VDRGDGKKTARRFPHEAANISEAKEQLEIKKSDRREERLPTAGRKPMLADYIESYLASPIRQKRRANPVLREMQARRAPSRDFCFAPRASGAGVSLNRG
jgi:hypothetical protein